MFRAIERDETLTSRVSGQVEKMIVSDRLKPGDRLPAERDLAGRFQVSRTVIREAICSLAARGLVVVRQGKGTVVSVPSLESVTQPMLLLLRGSRDVLDHAKVIEVRSLLEIEIAGLAAHRRTSQDLESMEQILESRGEVRSDRQKFVEWDMAFHAALARATRNELILVLLDSVAAVLRSVRVLGFDVPGTPDRAYRHHRAILDQVTAGAADKAREAMRQHLEESERTITRALRRNSPRVRGSENETKEQP